MLNFFTTSNGFRSTLPVVSNLTAMNVWDGVCMCFIYASLLEFVCVNYVGRKRPLHNVVYRPGENPVTQVMLIFIFFFCLFFFSIKCCARQTKHFCLFVFIFQMYATYKLLKINFYFREDYKIIQWMIFTWIKNNVETNPTGNKVRAALSEITDIFMYPMTNFCIWFLLFVFFCTSSFCFFFQIKKFEWIFPLII